MVEESIELMHVRAASTASFTPGYDIYGRHDVAGEMYFVTSGTVRTHVGTCASAHYTHTLTYLHRIYMDRFRYRYKYRYR